MSTSPFSFQFGTALSVDIQNSVLRSPKPQKNQGTVDAGGGCGGGWLCRSSPTDYRGVSELGANCRRGNADRLWHRNITLLPALISVLNPPGEPDEIDYQVLAPIDRFLQEYRVPVIVGTLAVLSSGITIALFSHLRL